MLKTKIKKRLLVILLVCFSLSQVKCFAFYPFPAKSKSLKLQENLSSSLLPTFRYDRNNIELNERAFVDLVLEKNAAFVKVEVVGAESIGFGIDDAILVEKGLKILRPRLIRKENLDSDISNEKIKSQERNTVTFNLKKKEVKPLLIEAVDFKILKVTIKGFLPGQYTLQATVDKDKTTRTKIITRPDFRLDAISPSVISSPFEGTITLIGKGLDSLTQVSFNSQEIKVLDTESLDTNILKVTVSVEEETSPGFRDVTIASPLAGNSVTLVGGLFINGLILTPDSIKEGPQGPQGLPGEQGQPGKDGRDGRGICDSPDAKLTIFTNNLPPGSQAAVFLDPVLCNLTFGIPSGFNGVRGNDGLSGASGMGLCNDLNATPATVVNTLAPGSMATVTLDSALCTITYGIPEGNTGTAGSNGQNSLVKVTIESAGANCTNGGKKIESGLDSNNSGVLDASEVQATNYVCNGTNGTNGINCWDLNGNGVNDSSEDTNMDSAYNTLDCLGPEIRTVEDLITNWNTLSDEQEFTTASGAVTRMIKIPFFIHDGIIYGGFWVDKYEASRSDATSTSEGTSSTPVSKRNVVPWTGINLASAKANASASGRQISGVGSCRLINMKEWYALYLIGRHAKVKGNFGATTTSGWNERGNTRSGKDGRNSSSYVCTDDPIENGGGTGRCLTGTGYKSWGHILDVTADKNTDGSTFSDVADNINNSSSAFDGDKQVYDLVGNIKEWIDFTVTKSGSMIAVDSGYQASGINLPFTTNNRYFSFDDILGNTNTSTNSDEIEFRGLGLPRTGASSLQTDTNGGINDGLFSTPSSNGQYGTIRGGAFNNSSGTDSRSPLFLDISSAITTTESSRGFRVICDFSNP